MSSRAHGRLPGNVFEKAQMKSYYKSPAQVGKLLRLHPDRAHQLPPLFDFGRAVGARFGPVSASSLSLPDLARGTTFATGAKLMSTWPDTRSVIAGAAPL